MFLSVATQALEVEATVRLATSGDVDAIATLINRANAIERWFVDGVETNRREVAALMERGYFLVLDERGSGELAASIYVCVREGSGRCGLLSVDPSRLGRGLDRRLIAVADAMCQAEGCTVVEGPTVHAAARAG